MPQAPSCTVLAWEKHHAEIRNFLERRTHDRELAQDLVQEVFLRALRQGRDFCVLDNPRAWLFQVARNALVDHLRRDKGSVALPDDIPEEKELPAPVEMLSECLVRSLEHLSAQDRDVIRRCDLEGMTLQRYAEANGLTLPAAKSRAQRARRRVREVLVRDCEVRFDERGRVCCHRSRQAA